MRVVWLSPLLLASVSLSLAPAEPDSSQLADQPCGLFPTQQASDCSLARAHTRATRDAQDSTQGSPRSPRSAEHKSRVKAQKRSRVARSAQEVFEVTDEDDSAKNSYPSPLAKNEDQLALQVQGDWRSLLKQAQAPAFLPSPRYCPHCRQLLPPDPPFLHHLVDPRTFLQVQQVPRFQVIPVNKLPPPYGTNEDVSNDDVNESPSLTSEEMCPFNYRMPREESETHAQVPPEFYNQTMPRPNFVKMKEVKKTAAGVLEKYLEPIPPAAESPTSSAPTKDEMPPFGKHSKPPTIEELTKYLENKKRK